MDTNDESASETKATHMPGGALSKRHLHVEFTGKRGELFKILLKNTLLGFLTLGIYRFWGKTRLRRYFWHSIRLGNEPLEYSGLPMELFIGMLIALAVLVPLGFAYDATYTAMLGTSESTLYVLDIAYYVVILALIHFAVFRVWRYRLSRTIWRGIHFHMHGQAWRYAAYAMAWTIGTIASVGIAYPWMRVALFRYRIKRMNFGNKAFSFTATTKPLILPWLVRIFVPLIIIGLGFAITYEEMKEFFEILTQIQAASDEGLSQKLRTQLRGESPVIFLFFFMISIFCGALLGVWYKVREMRVIASGIVFGSMHFTSAIRYRRICLIWLKLMFLITILFAASGALLASGILAAGALKVFSLIIGLFLLLGLLNIVMTLVIRYELTRHFCETLTITYEEELEGILQGISETPKHSEGFADALDVGAL